MDHEGRRKVHGDQPAALSDEARADRRELAAYAVERTRMPMVVTDATQDDQPIVLANQAFLDLTGYASHEILGKNCRFLQGPATSAGAIAEIHTCLSEGRGIDIELLNYRKDGSPFWNQLHVSPIHDDDGRLVYFFGSQIDRTDYRRIEGLEASEHRLLLEVNHRTNNVLALVDSIVRLSRSENAALYAASVQKRVQALARAHSLLSQRGWHNIPLRETILTQIEPYDASRAELSGPEVMLAAHAVQPLALFIHELIVNAAAYGALTNERGRIEICWDTVPDNKGLRLVWKEIGGPAPSAERKPGFGTAIGEATIRRQLLGSSEREWSDQGLRVVVEVPNVLAATSRSNSDAHPPVDA